MSTLLASVTSDPGPQGGQEHRSSGNFSTEDAPATTKALNFQVDISSNTNSQSITFDVKEDRGDLRPDGIVFSGLKSGDTREYFESRSLYIADPNNAGGNTFIVEIYASDG